MALGSVYRQMLEFAARLVRDANPGYLADLCDDDDGVYDTTTHMAIMDDRNPNTGADDHTGAVDTLKKAIDMFDAGGYDDYYGDDTDLLLENMFMRVIPKSEFDLTEHVHVWDEELPEKYHQQVGASYSPGKVSLVYEDVNGRYHEQPVSDLASSGTLIDPYTGDDMGVVEVVVRKRR